MMVHHSRVRVKICGITSQEDAGLAAQAGVDAIGLVFYQHSARHVTIEQALAITNAVPPFVSKVALFVNTDTAYIERVIQRLDIDLLQFHGGEPEEACNRYDKPYIKAISMRKNIDIAQQYKRYASAAALLLDSFDTDQYGGTGRAFDWSLAPKHHDKLVILAGGLNPGNVKEAIEKVRPFAVDVSSGVESSKGEKDAKKMHTFMRRVAAANDDIS